MNILTLIGRKKKLFESDLKSNESELIKIVSLAAKTNHIANGLQIPIDDVFELDKE